jgi:hypothetical protein
VALLPGTKLAIKTVEEGGVMNARKRRGLFLPLMGLCAVGAATAAWADQPIQPQSGSGSQQEGVIEPKADAQLKKMSDYLDGLKSFRVSATTIDEKVTREGQKVQELKESRLALVRPDKLRVERIGPLGHSVFIDDGQKLGVFNKEHNVYAQAKAPPGGLDATIDAAREKLNIDAPGGDLLVSHPYKSLTEGLQTGRYLGLEPIGNLMAHHIAVTGKNVDWQLWIQDGDKPVPLRYVITTKDMPSKPQFTVELHDWQPGAQVAADSFVFNPPAGARRVDLSAARNRQGGRND